MDVATGSVVRADSYPPGMARRAPHPEVARVQVRFAVDEAYVESAHRLADGDEVAVFPPVSGGVGRPIRRRHRSMFRLVDGPIDLATLDRTPKRSYRWLSEVARTRRLVSA